MYFILVIFGLIALLLGKTGLAISLFIAAVVALVVAALLD